MTNPSQASHLVAVIGAGAAGLFAARELAEKGVRVVLFNRDIKPGGLAEYGIYPAKYRLKEGLRCQFRQIIDMENVTYYGNVTICQGGDLTLDELRQLGFQALLVTVGAQATKWLGLPGEDLRRVYHAKDVVYHYNDLPPYSQRDYPIGKRVALIGVGNVMMDIARYLIQVRRVDEVIAIARRGPAEIKFDKNELQAVGANLDADALDEEIDRAAALMQSLGQNPQSIKDFVHTAISNATPCDSPTRLRLRFLLSPNRILGDEGGTVKGLQVEHNTLVLKNGEVKARGLGTYETLDVDTVIFAIGDRVDEKIGLPVEGNEYVKSPTPRYPVEGDSYEVFDPKTGLPVEGVFVAGWSRNASEGLVGIARKDGVRGARAILQYLSNLPPANDARMVKIIPRIKTMGKAVITKADLKRLEEVEQAQALARGLPEFKFSTNEEMLSAIREGAFDSTHR